MSAFDSSAVRIENATMLASMLDHTLLKPDATPAQIIKLCEEARFYRFATVCVNPVHVKLCLSQLATTEKPKVQVSAVVSYPLGATTEAIKVLEAQTALNHGAKEIELAINLGALKSGDFFLVQREIASVAKHCHDNRALCKVIVDLKLLDDAEKLKACELARAGGADYVWLSGASVKTVALVKRKLLAPDTSSSLSTLRPSLAIKVAGGVSNLSSALRLIEAGATRLGTSSSVQIMRQFSSS